MVKNLKYGSGLLGALALGGVGGYLGNRLEHKAVVDYAEQKAHFMHEAIDRLTTEVDLRRALVVQHLKDYYPNQPNISIDELAERLKRCEYPHIQRKLRSEFLSSVDEKTRLELIAAKYFGMINGARGIIDDEEKNMAESFSRWNRKK